jgi:dTDP-4-dehydrorhamnose reductase
VKILLIGANGQVGYELQRSLACLGSVISTDRKQLDLTNNEAIRAKIAEIAPELIVNAAAYTAVDKAESERALARQVNVEAVRVMAEEAKRLNILLIHYSTDYVFGGQGNQSWRENDNLAPINYYGESKLLGECAIQETGCHHLILRTSWVYGARGSNFLLTMMRLARDKETLSVVTDQIGAPTWSRHIADATAQIIAQYKGSHSQVDDYWSRRSGVYHLAASGQGSWYDFAEAIFQFMASQDEHVAVLSQTITADYPTPAQRPLFSCMNTDKMAGTFAIRLPDWRESLDFVMASFDSEA